MQNKNKIALLLAINMLFTMGCSSKLVKNNESEKANEKTITLYDKEGNAYSYNETTNVTSITNKQVNDFAKKTEENEETIEKSNSDINKEEKEVYYFLNKLAYVKENTSLYNTVSLDGENEIEKYQIVNVLEQYNDYSLIKTEENLISYIDNNKIEFLPNTFIEVDISSQTMNFYKDGSIVLTSSTVTGSKKHFTTLCYKEIYQMKKNIYLTGPTWKSYVNYWMAFNGGMGLHDATWRSEFGGEIYKENGSHGCVNLPKDIAKELYENVEIGTKVLVKK